MIRSVELLFLNHRAMLAIPYFHMVYTVPPWLKFVLKGVDMAVIPCVRTWRNDETRGRCKEGILALRDLVHKRLGDHGPECLFGPAATQSLDQFIVLSGGHFRDLLRLLREVLVKTTALPVVPSTIDRAILEVRSSFLPIAIDDAVWLDQIARERASPLRSDTEEDINRLTRFLDSHIVLYLRNGPEWYDVHPLVRDEVSRIVAAQSLATES